MQDLYFGNDGSILRCPFCFNGVAIRDPKDGTFHFVSGHTGYPALRSKEDRRSYYVRCRDCGTRTRLYPTQEQAIERWNKRVSAQIKRFGNARPDGI